MLTDVEESKNQNQNCEIDSEEIRRKRIFSDPDNCMVLGIQSKKLFEMEHSTTEFFVHRIKHLRNYKAYEIEII